MTSDGLCKEKGMVLVVAVLVMAILLVLGVVAMVTTSTGLRTTGLFKSDKQAFHVAEAGIEDAKARLRSGAASPIVDGHPTQSGWSAFIGTSTSAQGKGYNSGNAMHVRVDRLQTNLDYVVRVVHATDGSGNVLYWGDVNGDGINERTPVAGAGTRNIYRVSSEGRHGGATRTLTAELARTPPIHVPAALYVNTATTIQGSSTNIIGTDGCGGNDLPGVATTQAVGSVTLNGGPNVTGVGGATPNIVYNNSVMNVQSMVDRFKALATFRYAVSSTTHTGSSVPGPGDGWGVPAPGATTLSPTTCTARSIVHYNTAGTDIQMSNATGCGILLVEGDLVMHGNFSWYGAIVVTGSVTFTGGGNKNITGAILSGGSVDADLVGGNAVVAYCSSAVQNATESQPMQVLSWKDRAD